MTASFAAGAPARADGTDDRIVVTGTRSEVPLEDHAGNTARLTADEIGFIQADHISEALNRIPGMNMHRGNGAEHLMAIRSPVLTGGAGAGSFLYLENGVPLRAAGFANVNGLFEAHGDLASAIEVVRGPGSSLYGSNAVHGLINVIPPSPLGASRFAEVTAGSFGRYRANGAAAWGGDKQSLWLGGTWLQEDGYREDAGLDHGKLSARHLIDAGHWSGDTVVAFVSLAQETAGFIRGTDAYDDSQLAQTNPNPEAFRDAWAFRISSRWERDIGNGARLSLTPFARANEMEFLMHFLPSLALEESGHQSVGLQSAVYWDVGAHSLIFGLDGEWTSGFLRETQDLPTFGSFPQGVHYDYEVEAVVGAAYVHGEWQLTPRATLVTGFRAEATRYDYDNQTDANTIGRYQRPADRRDSYVTINPRLGGTYTFDEIWTGFANYARGSRAPQTTDLYRLQVNQDVGTIEEEVLDSFELGLRGAGERFFIEVAAYWMEKENFFFRDTDGFNVTDGRTRHIGVEAALTYALTDSFAVEASGTYARHTYRFDNTVAVNSTESISSGDDVDTAPRTLGNLRLVWTPTDALRGEVEWVHMGEYFTDAANLHDYPGHDLVNLRLNWDATESLSVFGALRNLTGTDYAERADFSFGSERYFPGESRALEIGVRKRF